MSSEKKFLITFSDTGSKPFFFSIKKVYLYFILILLSVGFLGFLFFGFYSFQLNRELKRERTELDRLERSLAMLSREVSARDQEDFFKLNYRLSIDKNNTIAVAGKLNQGTRGQPYRLFLAKYDQSRKKVWERYFGTGNNENLIAQIYDPRGFFLILTDFLEPAPEKQSMIKKNTIYIFNEKGKPVKTRTFNPTQNFHWFDMKMDSRGNVYLSGYDQSAFTDRSKKLEIFIHQLKPEENADSRIYLTLSDYSAIEPPLRDFDFYREKYSGFVNSATGIRN